MNVLVKSSSGITQVSADSEIITQRKVFIEWGNFFRICM